MTSSTLTSSQCYFCEQKAVTKCEKCQLVAFCSDFTHKEIHYDKQTNTCLAFKVRIRTLRPVFTFLFIRKRVAFMEFPLKKIPYWFYLSLRPSLVCQMKDHNLERVNI